MADKTAQTRLEKDLANLQDEEDDEDDDEPEEEQDQFDVYLDREVDQYLEIKAAIRQGMQLKKNQLDWSG